MFDGDISIAKSSDWRVYCHARLNCYRFLFKTENWYGHSNFRNCLACLWFIFRNVYKEKEGTNGKELKRTYTFSTSIWSNVSFSIWRFPFIVSPIFLTVMHKSKAIEIVWRARAVATHTQIERAKERLTNGMKRTEQTQNQNQYGFVRISQSFCSGSPMPHQDIPVDKWCKDLMMLLSWKCFDSFSTPSIPLEVFVYGKCVNRARMIKHSLFDHYSDIWTHLNASDATSHKGIFFYIHLTSRTLVQK